MLAPFVQNLDFSSVALLGDIGPGTTLFYLAVYALIIVVAALFGGWLPFIIRFSHTSMQILISLVGGLILGIAIFHLIPHALANLGENAADKLSICLMAGLLVMFLLLRTFHFHHHEPVDIALAPSIVAEETTFDPKAAASIGSVLPVLAPSTESHSTTHHHHDCDHDHHNHSHCPTKHRWLPVLFGLSLHSLLDGLAIAASVQADAQHGEAGMFGLLGIGTFLAICLHTPLDAMSITSLMNFKAWKPLQRLWIVAGFSLMCPLGAFLGWLGFQFSGGALELTVGGTLAFAAGLFLCIALSDLLPEMEFHSHNRLQLTGALLAGIAIAYAIGIVEPEHAHHHDSNVEHLHHE